MNLNASLTSIQASAIEKLNKLKVGALFMEPGTGKTLTAIRLAESTNSDYVLFIVPFQTKENIEEELRKWEFDMNYRIVGVESLSSSDWLYLELLDEVKGYRKVFIIVDESLKIKNAKAKRTKRVLEMGKYSEYRLVLNGTPISKNLFDLYPQMQFLSPKILNMTLLEFKNTFFEWKKITVRKINIYGKNQKKTDEFLTGVSNLEYLYSLIDPYVFDAELSLNIFKQHIDVPYSINENYDEYQELKESLLKAVEYGDDDMSFLKITQKMQQAYCVEPSKFESIKGIIDRNSAETIIFCKFIKSKEILQEQFPEVKILTYGKGSFGLNLQRFNTIIFWDKTFDYALQEQAERRIYRIGQSDSCTYYHLTGDVGLESMIDKNVKNKIQMLEHLKIATADSKRKEFLNKL